MRVPGFSSLVLLVAVGSTYGQDSPHHHHYDDDECRVEDVEEYYGEELKKDYDTRGRSRAIAAMLYEGPLMREADPEGLAYLSDLINDRKMRIREIEQTIQGHLYGDSDEFRDKLRKLEDSYGGDDREAAFKIVASVYKVFRYRPESPREEEFDACLVMDRRAYLVVTKILVEWMERHNLD